MRKGNCRARSVPRHRPIRLPVDGEKDTCCLARLRNAFHEHQDVSIRIGVDRSGTQRVLRERHRVVIGIVVAEGRSSIAGMDRVSNTSCANNIRTLGRGLAGSLMLWPGSPPIVQIFRTGCRNLLAQFFLRSCGRRFFFFLNVDHWGHLGALPPPPRVHFE